MRDFVQKLVDVGFYLFQFRHSTLAHKLCRLVNGRIIFIVPHYRFLPRSHPNTILPLAAHFHPLEAAHLRPAAFKPLLFLST